MSYFDYNQSKQLMSSDPSFNALIMAAMRKADSWNLEALQRAFPETWQELQTRYNAPGGVLEHETQLKINLGMPVDFEDLPVDTKFKFIYDVDNATLEKISDTQYKRIDNKDPVKYIHSSQSGKVVKIRTNNEQETS